MVRRKLHSSSLRSAFPLVHLTHSIEQRRVGNGTRGKHNAHSVFHYTFYTIMVDWVAECAARTIDGQELFEL